jgi:hypothetical protein
VSEEIIRSLVARINAERLRETNETAGIHRRWLDELHIAQPPRAAEALTWSDDVAPLARLRAARRVAQTQITHADSMNGESVLASVNRITGASLAGEIVWHGLNGWFSEESLYEQLVGSATSDPRSSRSILLNPAFHHIGAGWAQDATSTLVILLHASDVEAGLPAGVQSYLLAEVGGRAAARESDMSAVPLQVDVYPLWEPAPLRWRMTLARDSRPVRAQIAAQLGVRPELLHGFPRGGLNADAFFAEASSSRVPDGWQVAISLAEIDPELVTFSIPAAPPASPGQTVQDAPSFTTAMKDALGPLTANEEALCHAVIESGGGFVPPEGASAERSFPERPPGAEEQAVVVHACVDAGTGDPEILSSVFGEMLENSARAYEISAISSYAVTQELFVTWDANDPDADDFARSELLRIGAALAKERGAAVSAGIPIVYARAYRGDDGHRDAILDDTKRMYWLHSVVAGPRFAAELRRAAAASLRRFDTVPRAEDTLAFSQTSVATFISDDDLLASAVYWQGLAGCVEGVFREMHVSEAACHQEAIDILTRCGLLWSGAQNDFDPVRDVQQAARTALWPVAVRYLNRVARMQLSNLRRRAEPPVLTEMLRWQESPADLAGAVPGLMGAAREALWISLSILRREIAGSYRRHLAGDGGRNVASFLSVCELLDAHLRGPRSPFHNLLPDGSRVFRSFDLCEAALRTRLATTFTALDLRYKHWFRRLLRFLFRNGRSRLPNDLRQPMAALFDDIVALFAVDYYRHMFGASDAMPRTIIEQLTHLSEAVSEYADAERARHDSVFSALTAGQTVFLSEKAQTIEDARALAKAHAKRLWNGFISGSGARRWMSVGERVMNADGRMENPFAPHSGPVFVRLVTEVGRATAALINGLPPPTADHAQTIQAKAQQLLHPAGIDTNRLAVVVPATMDGDVVSRTWWHVVAGLPHHAHRGRAGEIRRALGSLQNVCFGELTWTEAPAMTGLFIFQDIHGLSRSCMQP